MTGAGSTWLDISAALDGQIPTWPTSRGRSVQRTREVQLDGVAESFIAMDVHSGTHVDAPAHLIEGGSTVADLGLSRFLGPSLVVDATACPHIDATIVNDLVPAGVSRVLFRTENSVSGLMRRADFVPTFVGLTAAAAQELASRPELLLVGVDYLSVQPYGGNNESHLALMRRDIAIVEGLDLADVSPGPYTMMAAPLRLDFAEAAPLRALLRREGTS